MHFSTLFAALYLDFSSLQRRGVPGLPFGGHRYPLGTVCTLPTNVTHQPSCPLTSPWPAANLCTVLPACTTQDMCQTWIHQS